MKTTINTVLFLSMLLVNFTTDRYIFLDERYPDFGKLKLADVKIFEQVSPVDTSDKFAIGESIYPNKKKFEITGPQIYKTIENQLEIETEYFYTAKDNSVKVILYQWDKIREKKVTNNYQIGSDLLEPEKDLPEKFKRFQEQYDHLAEILTKKLGQPKKVNIEENKPGMGTFRNDVKWSHNNLNAYLFMFGNPHGYREIRLAIYAD